MYPACHALLQLTVHRPTLPPFPSPSITHLLARTHPSLVRVPSTVPARMCLSLLCKLRPARIRALKGAVHPLTPARSNECSSPSEWGLSLLHLWPSEFGTGPQIMFGLAGKPYLLQADVCFLTWTFLQYLALVNDGTAVAVNYAMTRTFSTTPRTSCR
jgi:hypothetical protein